MFFVVTPLNFFFVIINYPCSRSSVFQPFSRKAKEKSITELSLSKRVLASSTSTARNRGTCLRKLFQTWVGVTERERGLSIPCCQIVLASQILLVHRLQMRFCHKKKRNGMVAIEGLLIFHRALFHLLVRGSMALSAIVCSPSPLPITYFWTMPLSLDHPYLIGKITSSKIADTKVSGF